MIDPHPLQAPRRRPRRGRRKPWNCHRHDSFSHSGIVPLVAGFQKGRGAGQPAAHGNTGPHRNTVYPPLESTGQCYTALHRPHAPQKIIVQRAHCQASVKWPKVRYGNLNTPHRGVDSAKHLSCQWPSKKRKEDKYWDNLRHDVEAKLLGCIGLTRVGLRRAAAPPSDKSVTQSRPQKRGRAT